MLRVIEKEVGQNQYIEAGGCATREVCQDGLGVGAPEQSTSIDVSFGADLLAGFNIDGKVLNQIWLGIISDDNGGGSL